VLIIDTLLLGGIRFVLDKIAAAVDAELHDDTRLKEELLAAQMRLEMGELSEAEFAHIERELLAAIRAVRDRRRDSEEEAGELKITGIEATTWSDDTDDRTDTPGGRGR
jgi:gas vesicle protein GvpG